ncbi:MAG TPA: SDR family oxidoreductase [Acidimicrobiia bacterium]|nr:SDR family oxidoreductase [Acidimicrobiia bacterium]
MELRGVTALVTGSAHRVGKAIALGLAGRGCNVLLHFHASAAAAADTVAEIRALGVRAEMIRGDLSADPGAVIAAAGDLAPVQVLVNSAAVFPEDRLIDVTPDQWARTVAVNLTAPVFLTQAFAAALPEGLSGAVLNVSDWRTQRPYPDHFSYTVAKGGLDTFTRAAAVGLAPRIRVNAVALGAILPPPGKDSSYLKALAQRIPLQRVGGTEPVVAAALALIENDFITGEILRVDGGAHLGS